MRILIFLVGIVSLAACKLTIPAVYEAQFSSDPTVTPITAGQIDEASGLADSRSMPGNLWIEQDSGNPAVLTLLGYDGKVKNKVAITNSTNRDWEDIAIGPGPTEGINYIYIGEFGDNNNQYLTSIIYRLPEPASLQVTSATAQRINYRYPDGPRDTEAMLVDPTTKDIYLISKRDELPHLYVLPYPQDINTVTVATSLGTLPYLGGGLANYVTSAAISTDGQEILLRTYTQLYYWKRDEGKSIAATMTQGTYRQLTVRLEPQGEAVCFDKDNRGFFTISEKASAASVNLYYYARK